MSDKAENRPQLRAPTSANRKKTTKYDRPHTPAPTIDALREKLQSYDRSPFLDVLADFLANSPTGEAIAEFADRHPDRWAGAMASIARVGGFSEKTEINNNVHVVVHKMSDSQLEDRLRALSGEINIPLITDVGFEEVQVDVPEAPSETVEENAQDYEETP